MKYYYLPYRYFKFFKKNTMNKKKGEKRKKKGGRREKARGGGVKNTMNNGTPKKNTQKAIKMGN